MVRSLKQPLLLLSSFVTSLALSFGSVAPASAATGALVAGPTVTDFPAINSCRFNANFSVTGTAADSVGGSDQFRAIVTDATNADFGSTNGILAPSNTGTLAAAIPVSSTSGRRQYEIALQDVFGPLTGNGPPADLVRVSVPRPALIAAGGNCLDLAVNQAPGANAGPDQNVGPNTVVTLDGSGSSDADGDQFSFQWAQISGPAVAISASSTANPIFLVPNISQTQQYVFSLTTTDIVGESTTDTVTVTAINNAPPVVDAGPDQTVSGSTTVTLVGSATDPENDPLTFQWTQVSGPSVTLSNTTTTSPTFTAPATTGSVQTLIFELVANDGTSNSPADQVTITIAANQPPTANAGPDQTVNGGDTVTLAGSRTDPENDAVTFQWTQVSGPSVTLSSAFATTPSFTAPASTAAVQTLVFELVVFDNFSSSPADQVTITVAANQSPVADAGPDQTVGSGALVTLDGTGSTDPENDSLTFSWNQAVAPFPIVLSNSNTAMPTFTAPTVAGSSFVTFVLTVNDGTSSSTDLVTIFLNPNQSPVADAGPDQTVSGGSLVALAGSGTDPEMDPLSFAWTQVSGPSVTLSSGTTATPSFTAPASTGAVQTLVFELVANDGLSNSPGDQVTVTVLGNQSPTANAGADQLVAGGDLVALAGSGSDPDMDPLSFQWTQVGGPSVTLSNATSATPSFTAPAATGSVQTLVFALTVSDGTATSPADTVTVSVSANQTPTVNAGPDQSVFGGETVNLAGSGSDPDGDPLTYMWTQVSGPAVSLSSTTSLTPSFTAPATTAVDQVLIFELVGTDGITTSAPDRVSVTVAANQIPVAAAGPDQSVAGGSIVTLAGAGRDPDGDPLTYMWAQVSGPAITLSDPTSLSATFTAPVALATDQVIVLSLTANDGISSSVPDEVSITINANQVPVADAGADQSVQGSSLVTLMGAGSDADGDPLTYTWTQVSGPTVTLSDATSLRPTFTAPAATGQIQTLIFALVASDGIASSPADTVTVSVEANQVPIANAGPDQGPINALETVVLNGAGSSDPDGDALSYSWSQVGGPSVTLTGATSVSPSFVAPDVANTAMLTFQLVVSDGQVASAPDRVQVVIQPLGSITIQQQVQGPDGTFTYTSSLAALSGSLATQNGVGRLVAENVSAGSYVITAGDARDQGFALTDIVCSDGSTTNLAARQASVSLQPGEDVICTFSVVNSRSAAQEAIRTAMTVRSQLVLASEPSSQRRFDRLRGRTTSGNGASIAGLVVPGSNAFGMSATITDQHQRFSGSLASAGHGGVMKNRLGGLTQNGRLDVWGEAQFSQFDINQQEGKFSIYYVGADYLVSDRVLLGGMVQVDDFTLEGAGQVGDVDGQGWMAGPYMTTKLTDHLFFDARAAWGSSDNSVNPLGTYSDEFDTSRALYAGTLTGEFGLGGGVSIMPEVSIKHLRERQKDYVDSLGVVIPEQTVDLGEIAFGPQISRRISYADGSTFTPFIGASGIYSFGDGIETVLGTDTRIRVEGGGQWLSKDGVRFGLSGFADGLGSGTNLESYGASLSLAYTMK